MAISKKENAILFKRAFFNSLPVLMGYSTMGFAAGVLLAAHSNVEYAGFWGFLTGGICISGALQFMIAEWVRVGTPLLDVAVLTFCLNVRYAMYGLSLLEKFRNVSLGKKLYLIWALTDETYALEVGSKYRSGEKDIRYCLYLAFLDHFYWIFGVTSGALVGKALPFPDQGIDFAMTALFLVILTDQCKKAENRFPALLGLIASLISLFLFGVKNMLIPAMGLMVVFFLLFRRKLDMPDGELPNGEEPAA